MRLPWLGDPWMVISVPFADKPLAEAVAQETGMRLADGVPHCFHAGGRDVFPLQGPNVWTLENDDAAHPDWKARRTHPQEALKAELAVIEGIMQRHYDRLPYELAEELTLEGKPAWIKCRTCEKTSYNKHDIAAHYCGFCNKHHLPLDNDLHNDLPQPEGASL